MLDSAWWQAILHWGAENPYMVLALILLTGALESSFLIGMVIPATPMLFALAALVATTPINPWWALLAAGIGGVMGDQASFWIGRWLRDDLRRYSERSRYGKFISHGEAFFQKHGGKSIAAGRMLGALRPVMPTVAGAAGMSALSFTLIDTLMQIPWVLVYIVPGLFFGASLDLLAEVGGHLLLLVTIVLLPLGLALWLSWRSFSWLSRRSERNTLRLLRWSQKHRRLGLLGPNLADPRLPEAPALGLLALILLLLTAGITALLWSGSQPTPAALDAFTYFLFQKLHTPWTDPLALILAQLGSWQVYLPLAATVLVLLVLRRRWLSAAHWLAALGFGALLAYGSELLLAVPEPLAYYREQARASGHAAGHLIMTTVVYGFLAAMLATGRSRPKRRAYYAVAITLITLIGLARLYLGSQWLLDAVLGAFIGAVWVLMLSLGYRRHLKLPLRVVSLTLVSLLVVVFSIGWRLHTHLDAERSYYLPAPSTTAAALPQWQAHGFAQLPAWRMDLAEQHNSTMNLQWRGRLATIREQLLQAGWQAPPALGAQGMLQWLSDSAQFSQMPLLPLLHRGQAAALLLEYPHAARSGWVLRLWPSHWQADGQALWIGNLAQYQLHETLFVLQLPRQHSSSEALAFLQAQFPASHLRLRSPGAPPVLLLDSAGEASGDGPSSSR